MAEAVPEHHISSAVVNVRPEHAAAVAARLDALPDTEVHRVAAGKIVIVMEGPSTRVLGERLTGIALMDHVLAANMVYEVVDSLEAIDGDAPEGEEERGEP